ncbi:unnamed protein product [Kuraishia capsulata CBS 1993]|uniref:Mitochondrial ornithine carrier protein n=1 Tax=Kuraishia capsulata CBS 1993 TaxID=1382522 RepID=W6MRL2_9ASCO|nr:uncharacterized protein KUCA_T00005389001 [Kuraishia capsulata CBS 1993]CDK29401.1 unnamed protein product [Kuraishia capsulata CBS 1993]
MADDLLVAESKVTDGLKEVLFGSIAGAAGKVVEFPFDTVKVRLQYSQTREVPLFNSALDCIRKTYHSEGFFNGFYKGIASPVFGASLEMSCLFLSYNVAQDAFKKHRSESTLSIIDKTACGAISGMVTAFILTPIELVKCQMQVQNLQSTAEMGIGKVIRKLLQEDGLLGFWRGHSTTLIREAGGSAFWFGSYEYTLELLKRVGSKKESSTMDQLAAGAIAGVTYNFSIFPVDTVKSIIQTHEGTSESNSMVSVTKWIWKHGGVKGFYQGLGVALLKAVPANAIVFFVYENLKKEFN